MLNTTLAKRLEHYSRTGMLSRYSFVYLLELLKSRSVENHKVSGRLKVLKL
jgi:hypothetical protein